MKRVRWTAALLSMALLCAMVPLQIASAAGLTVTRTWNASGTVLTTTGSGTLTATVDDSTLATVTVDGDTATVTGAEGAAGIVTVTLTRDGVTLETEVAVGYTTFVFDGDSVTVYAGSGSNYEVVGMNAADEEDHALTTEALEDGGTRYTNTADATLSVNIKKKGGTYLFAGTCSDGAISVKKEATAAAALLFDTVDLTSSFTSPVTIKKDSTSTVTIKVLQGTTSKLTDAANNNADVYGPTTDGGDGSNQYFAESAVIKGKTSSNLTLCGTGTLILKANAKNGVKLGESSQLTISDLTLFIDSADHGISCENLLTIQSGVFAITAAGDGIRAEDDTELLGSIVINGGTFTLDTVGDGIYAAAALTIQDGDFDITCADGASNTAYNKDDANTPSAKGLKAEGALTVNGGTFVLDTADDAIHGGASVTILGGTFDISSGDDGMHADYIMTIGQKNGGSTTPDIYVRTCYEGIEGAAIHIWSGKIRVYSEDDGINAANSDLSQYSFSVNIYGGDVKVYASLGDGLDANGVMNIRGGEVEVYGGIGNEANNALDCDGALNLLGGTTIGVGQSQMVVTPTTGVYVMFTNVRVSSGTTISIRDASGTELYGTTAYWNSTVSGRYANHILFSSALLTSGESYTVYLNGSASQSATAAGTQVEYYDWVNVSQSANYVRSNAIEADAAYILTDSTSTASLTGGSTLGTAAVTAAGSSPYTLTGVVAGNTWTADASGHLTLTVGAATYYLTYRQSGGSSYALTVTTAAQSAATWQYANGKLSATLQQGGMGGNPPGGATRAIYLTYSNGAFGVSTTGSTVYAYTPAIAQAALVGETSFTITQGEALTLADIQQEVSVLYRANAAAGKESLSWSDARITTAWDTAFDATQVGVYTLTVSFDGVAIGSIVVTVLEGDIPTLSASAAAVSVLKGESEIVGLSLSKTDWSITSVSAAALSGAVSVTANGVTGVTVTGVYRGSAKVIATVVAKNSLGVSITLQVTIEVTVTESESDLLYGDANCDTVVTSADASAILRQVVGLESLTAQGKILGDVNGDTAITSADATEILRYTVGVIDHFAVEE